MNQDEINQTEWDNPSNWSGPRWAAVYFSKRDTRTLVPKRIPLMGWTVNLGQASGVFWMLGALVGIPLLIMLIIVLTGGGS